LEIKAAGKNKWLTIETPQPMSCLAASIAAIFGILLLKCPMKAIPIDLQLYPLA